MIISLFIFLLNPTPAFANNNFQTSYDVTYAVQENGLTKATYLITLTNATSKFFASSYTLNLGFSDIQNLAIGDNKEQIDPKIEKTKEGTKIIIPFTKKVVGKGKSTSVTVVFETRDIAKKLGKVWEVNTPAFADQSKAKNIFVLVTVPRSFDTPLYVKPQPDIRFNPRQNEFLFTKKELQKSGISISFGNNQILNFTLKYHLKNSFLLPTTQTIAIPPSTNYQTVYISSISPKPKNVVLGADGNWLAEYQIVPFETKEITVKGTSVLTYRPKQVALTSAERQIYLKEQPYWNTNAPEIQKLARELKTPKNIYNYVVKTLTYDFSRVANGKERAGALSALKNPDSAVCLEFTDLFIALSRAAGIPAREVNGYAYTENVRQRPLSLVADILHAWPEYYDEVQKTWVMVDPTWGNTTGGTDYFKKLDTDHFAFVVKGNSSTSPQPAGDYKLNNNPSKDINITFADTVPATDEKIKLEATSKKPLIAGLPIYGSITLTNLSSTLIVPKPVVITGNLSKEKQTLSFAPIPPFGTLTQPFSFNTPFLTNKQAIVTIQLNHESLTQKVFVSAFPQVKWSIVLGGVFLVILVVMSIFTARAGYLPFFRRK